MNRTGLNAFADKTQSFYVWRNRINELLTNKLTNQITKKPDQGRRFGRRASRIRLPLVRLNISKQERHYWAM